MIGTKVYMNYITQSISICIFSNKNGTLIDNIFCKLLPSTQEHCSGMLLNSQTRKKPPPKYMTIKKLTQHALLNIHNDLEEKNKYEKLDK